ncbi:MAG: GNAT family N-acetyltransferase [Ruminococcaceae bacterium]|nr:GNAT family N-acetyltransferase [Oscillospiraceae bacterium]
MKMRKIEEKDREIFMVMGNEFYSGPGVLHKVDPKVLERTFDEMVSESPFLEGFIFEKDGRIAGYAELSYSFAPEVGGRSIFIEEIFVCEEYRNRGIGHEFLEYVVSLVKGDLRRVRLEATRSNEKAVALYRRFGFEELDYMQMVIDRP